MRDSGLIVYTPESPLCHPVRMLRAMFHDLRASRELAWRLCVRDISAQYRQSILGYVWAFIPPLVASLPFIFLRSQGIVGIKDTVIPYAAYALIGTMIWQVFVDALSSPLKTVIAAKPMLAKINFPREAILLSGLGQVFFNFLIRLILLVAVFAWFRIVPPITAALFPLGILSLVTVGFMLGVLLTPIGILYSDVPQMIPMLSVFLMLLTPVVYPPPQSGPAASLAHLNPLSPLVIATRDWITTGQSSHLFGFCAVSSMAVLLLFVGWVLYRIALPHIVARIGT
jgi:lipopolysaccharide transport system permease protein